MGKSSLRKKIKSAIYVSILVVSLAIMISPLPEGTIILSLIISYFGYKLTGNIYVTIATYIVTFVITLILIKKLNLIAKFKAQLKKIAARREDEEAR